MFAISQTKQSQKKHVYSKSNSIQSRTTCLLLKKSIKSEKTRLLYFKLDQVKRQAFTENQIASSHYMFIISQMT